MTGLFFGNRCFAVLASAAFIWPMPLPMPGASIDAAFFEQRIRPVLVERCYSCHSHESEKLKGGLYLDARASLLQGGNSGAAVLPGKPDESLLIKAIRQEAPDLKMPPKGPKLSERQIGDLADWVAAGVPWGMELPLKKTAAARPAPHWAFQPLSNPSVPADPDGASPIDRFIRTRLKEAGLQPNGPADKRALIRRTYFDLIGLPPPPEEVDSFLSDRRPDAWSRVVQQLLGRPQYGERWARHWLDVVRYAQSNGYERDGEKPFAWRYRDYVIRAFNEDKPYDHFILEQIAGDQILPRGHDAVIATGFQRLGVWDDEPDDKLMAEYDELDDIISTTGNAFLGLTLGCARCHDHKFDPISQKEYYQFLAFFRKIRPNAAPKFQLDSPSYLPLQSEQEISGWLAEHNGRIAKAEAEVKALPPEKQKARQAELQKLREEQPPFQWALAVRDRDGETPATHLFPRGNPHTPGVQVEAGFPKMLVCPDLAQGPSRVRLGKWIGSPSNPLTARVMVNRIWQHHFGKGLVKTTTDFGKAGSGCSNPELLDWLAGAFIRSGWSVKTIHRLVLLSSAYQMSSAAENKEALRKDPANNLLWRQEMRRLEAEPLRDSLLAAAGNLNLQIGGRGFFPRLGGEVLAGASRPGLDWEKNSRSAESRRSIYTYLRRSMLPPILESFDYNNTASPLGERPSTTVAPQALLLLNEPFVSTQAAELAARLARENGAKLDPLIARAYYLAFGRPPSERERKMARAFIERQKRTAAAADGESLTLRCDVPSSLSVQYMDQLQADDFLLGAPLGWTSHRGGWSAPYEGIRTVDRAQLPFALSSESSFADGTFSGALVFANSSEAASLLLRGKEDQDLFHGLEATLNPRQQSLTLSVSDPRQRILLHAHVNLPPRERIPFRIELRGNEVSVFLAGANAGQAAIPADFSGAGKIGLRVAGAPVTFQNLAVDDGKQSWRIRAPAEASPDQKALHLFCLMLLNLNEFIYVE